MTGCKWTIKFSRFHIKIHTFTKLKTIQVLRSYPKLSLSKDSGKVSYQLYNTEYCISYTEKYYKNSIKSKGGDLVKLSKVTTLLLVLLLATAQFAVSAGSPDQTSIEAKTPETTEEAEPSKEDIIKHRPIPIKILGSLFISPCLLSNI